MSRLALYSGARSTMNSTAALHSIAPSAIGDARVPLCLLQWYRKCSRCHSKAGSGNSTHAQPTPATRSGVTRVHTVLCHAKWYGRSRYSTARQRVWRHGGACALVAAEWHSLYSAAGSTLRLLAIDPFPPRATAGRGRLSPHVSRRACVRRRRGEVSLTFLRSGALAGG